MSHMNDIEQAELLKAWWKKYGNIITTVIVAIILAIAGWRYWQGHEQAQREKASATYDAMLMSIDKKADDTAIAQAELIVKQYPNSGYADLASLYLAAQSVKKQDWQLAAKHLQWVVAHSNNKNITSIATLRLARVMIANSQSKKAITLLKPLVNAPGFSVPALIITGQAYHAEKNNALALEVFNRALALAPKDASAHNYIQMLISGVPVSESKAPKMVGLK